VSALVEKYTSLSSNSSAPGSPSPSRLPVRASSLSKDLPTPGSSSVASAGVEEAPLPLTPNRRECNAGDDDTLNGFPTASSSSDHAPIPSQVPNPVRYVHGAPLHNLPGDPEEE
jgi:hypothetical protein